MSLHDLWWDTRDSPRLAILLLWGMGSRVQVQWLWPTGVVAYFSFSMVFFHTQYLVLCVCGTGLSDCRPV